MCARPTLLRTAVTTVAAILVLAACSSPERTGTAFCGQLARELPAIAEPVATGDDVSAMVSRWERLLERSPLSIESDVETVTELFRSASRVDPSDTDQVQALADQSYAANKSAEAVRDWVKDTCAVDVATGVTIAPPRTAPSTTIAATTTVAAAATTVAPATTPAAATTVPQVPPGGTTAP